MSFDTAAFMAFMLFADMGTEPELDVEPIWLVFFFACFAFAVRSAQTWH